MAIKEYSRPVQDPVPGLMWHYASHWKLEEEEKENAKRYGQVLQHRQGFWFHHAGRWRQRRVCSRQRHRWRRPPGGHQGRVRGRRRKERAAGQRREGRRLI